MSTEDLRDLLHERVADETHLDLAPAAWRTGRRQRRRRSLAIVGGATAAVVAAAGGTWWATTPSARDDGRPAGPTNPPSGLTDTASPPPKDPEPAPTEPDAVVDGTEMWDGPTRAEEARLPQVDTALPETIDLGVLDDPATVSVETSPLGVALAAVAVSGDQRTDRVLLVGADGNRYLDVSHLKDRSDGENGFDPVSATMLSPTGRYLGFGQGDHIEIFDITTGTWMRVDPPGFAGRELTGVVWQRDDGLVPYVDFPAPGKQAGFTLPGLEPTLGVPLVNIAEGSLYGARLDVRLDPAAGGGLATARSEMFQQLPYDGGTGDAESILVSGDGLQHRLVIPPENWRSKLCCPVVAFAPDGGVFYESRTDRPSLVRWKVGTHEFGVATQITGVPPNDFYVASWASQALV